MQKKFYFDFILQPLLKAQALDIFLSPDNPTESVANQILFSIHFTKTLIQHFFLTSVN